MFWFFLRAVIKKTASAKKIPVFFLLEFSGKVSDNP